MTGFESILAAEGSDGSKGEDGAPESSGREQQQAASEEGNRRGMHGCTFLTVVKEKRS